VQASKEGVFDHLDTCHLIAEECRERAPHGVWHRYSTSH
jgi:hypothetical protein